MNVDTIKIQKQLKKKVFGQDELIETLSSVALIHEINKDNRASNKPAINNKSLLIGGSGCGKTQSIKELSKILNVNFINVDGSKLQGNNYGGASHAYDFLNEAIMEYGKEGVENSIIFIDEFDKTLDVYSLNRHGSRIVQRDLLKLFDNDVFETTARENGEKVVLNTAYMTFICAGSFVESLTANDFINGTSNYHTNRIGFGQNENSDNCEANEITEEQLLNAGHLPELIGRFSRIVNLKQLTEEDVINILKYGDNQLNTFKEYFKSEGISLIATDNYYNYLSKMVDLKQLGFRGVNKLVTKDVDSILASYKNINASTVKLDANNEKVLIEYINKDNTLIHSTERDIGKNISFIQPTVIKHRYQELN